MYSASQLTATAPADAYACATDQFKKLGYRIRAHDDTDYRIVAERENEEIKEPTGLFRRGFDRLELTSAADASGKTAMGIKAQSYKESVTARGNTLDEIKVTDRAVADSKTILSTCGPS
jgi:serine/threonine protein kinase HipA of HipAB toxin-antitoxin module